MPLQVSIDPHARLVTVFGVGPASVESIRGFLLRLVADPRFETGYSLLMDARDLDFTPTSAEIRFFVEFHMSHEVLRRSRTAVVVASTVDFGMANMFAALCDLRDAPVRSFQSISEAVEWLV